MTHSAFPSQTFARCAAGTLKLAICACALVAVAACAYVIISRIAYTYSLEYCESAALHTVLRVLEGNPLYVEPSVDYTCYEYTPLYYFVAAAASLLTGPGFLPLRLVSLISTLIICILIYLFVKKETTSTWHAAAAIGLFAALYGHVFAWFDLARVDMLFIALFMAALYILRFHPSRYMPAVAAGLLLFLGWFTKQSVSFMILPLFAYLAITRTRHALATIATFGAAVALTTLVYNIRSGGWFWFYTVELLSQQKFLPDQWLGYWTDGVFGKTAILMAASILYAIRAPRPEKGRWFYLFLLLGLLAGCWTSRLHSGSSINSLLPLYVFGVIGFTLWAAEAMKQTAGCSPARVIQCAAVTFGLFLAQFYNLQYARAHYIPTQDIQNLQSGLVDLFASIEGDVFMPTETSLPYFAGKPPCADHVPTTDLLRGTDSPKMAALENQFRTAFQSGRFALLVIKDNAPYYNLFKDTYVELPCKLIDPPVYQLYAPKQIAPTLTKKLAPRLPLQ